MDEVWWLSKGSGDVGANIFIGGKPEIVPDPFNDKKTVSIPSRDCKRIGIFRMEFAGDFIKDGEIIPIRPLRIERVEVEE